MIPGFFFSSGRVPAVKEKGDGLRKAQSGFFPTSRRAGPLPFFTWRSPRHHHFAVHRSEISSHSLSVFAFPFRDSLFGSLFGSPSQGVPIPLPFPLASHTPSVCKAFSNFFPTLPSLCLCFYPFSHSSSVCSIFSPSFYSISLVFTPPG